MSATINGTCTCTWGANEYLKHADEHDFCPVHDCEGCGYPRGCCAGQCGRCDEYVKQGRARRGV